MLSIILPYAFSLAIVLSLTYAALAVHSWRFHSMQRLQGLQGLQGRQAAGWPRWARLSLLAALGVHAALLCVAIAMPQSLQAMPGANPSGVVLNLGFAQVLSLVSCVGVGLLMVESRWVAIDALRPLALALPAVAVLLAAVAAPKPTLLHHGAVLHVLLAIAAHGVALLACGHGVLLMALSKALKNTQATSGLKGGIKRSVMDSVMGALMAGLMALAAQCPPLVVLEQLIIRLSLWVTGLLGLTVVLGMASGQMRLDHKTVLTVASLLAWIAVPVMYRQRRWRGATLCWATVFATGLLLLAYIGSRFVLQAVLHR